MEALKAADKAEQEESGIDVERKPEITIDDFDKIQIRIGEIIKCEAVPKSKKLLYEIHTAVSLFFKISKAVSDYYILISRYPEPS